MQHFIILLILHSLSHYLLGDVSFLAFDVNSAEPLHSHHAKVVEGFFMVNLFVWEQLVYFEEDIREFVD